jgi:AcrR family transcriptional regulator
MAQLSAAERVALQRVELMRRELVTLARAPFLGRGYEAVTVEELAAHAGTSLRTFCPFFRFKLDILVAVFDDFTEAFASVGSNALRRRVP